MTAKIGGGYRQPWILLYSIRPCGLWRAACPFCWQHAQHMPGLEAFAYTCLLSLLCSSCSADASDSWMRVHHTAAALNGGV